MPAKQDLLSEHIMTTYRIRWFLEITVKLTTRFHFGLTKSFRFWLTTLSFFSPASYPNVREFWLVVNLRFIPTFGGKFVKGFS